MVFQPYSMHSCLKLISVQHCIVVPVDFFAIGKPLVLFVAVSAAVKTCIH